LRYDRQALGIKERKDLEMPGVFKLSQMLINRENAQESRCYTPSHLAGISLLWTI
jgi:hypothetical protein